MVVAVTVDQEAKVVLGAKRAEMRVPWSWLSAYWR